MDTKEHFYSDDPAVGPADVRTSLKYVDYFFIGNGHIQAAVQVSPSGVGTPLGLLIMHPERLGPKRGALTMDVEVGLAPTMISIAIGAKTLRARPTRLSMRWTTRDGIPAASVTWKDGGVTVEERFYCPDLENPRLIREIHVNAPPDESYVIRTGLDPLEMSISPKHRHAGPVVLEYCIRESGDGPAVDVRWCEAPPSPAPAAQYWSRLTKCTFSSGLLDHLFNACRSQLPAVPAKSGKLDASIWQYNREWLRDQTMVVAGRLMLGDFRAARRAIVRLLAGFVTDEGDTIDSSCRRPSSETELDQNGELLMLLKAYVDWTGDLSIVSDHWERVRKAAEFPLRDVFRHRPSGLLHNRREYWERHGAHGIGDGIELAHQLYVSMGLTQAAVLAKLLGHETEARRWNEEGARLKRAMLEDDRFSLIEGGVFIKRRRVDGRVQREISVAPDADLPREIPLFWDEPHCLDPDTSTLYPITLGFVDPHCEPARNTLDLVEQLWNQRWNDGGYGRYNVTSEAGAAGPWPIASMLVAQAALEVGADEHVWRVLDWIGSTPGSRAGSWLEFFGDWPVPPYPQVGIIPWAWVEVLRFFIHHLLGVRPGVDGLTLRPRLLSGLEQMEASVRVRDHRIHLVARKGRDRERPGYRVNGESHRFDAGGLVLPLPISDLEVEAVLPGRQ